MAVDDPEVADDAGQELRLAAVDQVDDARPHEAPDLVGALIEHVPRQIEAECGLLEREPLFDAPRFGVDERRLLGAGRMRIAEVEKAALVGVRGLRVGPVEGAADAREDAGPIRMKRVESAGLHQRFDDAAVDALPIDARTEIEEAAERTGGCSAVAVARREDRLDRTLSGALAGTEAEAQRL